MVRLKYEDFNEHSQSPLMTWSKMKQRLISIQEVKVSSQSAEQSYMSTLTVIANNVFALIIVVFLSAFQISCTLSANISSLNAESSSKRITLKIQDNNNHVDINEGSTIVLIVSQSEALTKDSFVKLHIEENGFTINSSFNGSFPISQTLKAGDSVTSFTLNSLHDPTVTGQKSFRILLESENPEVIGTQLDLNLLDLEADQPTLSVSDISVTEGQNAVLNFSLNHTHTQAVTLNYSTVSGSAVAGTHFVTKSGPLTIPAGVTSQPLSISTIANPAEICASDKTFSVQISNVQSATFTATSPLVTITDPDRPTVSIGNTSGVEGTNLNFTVSLSAICANYDVGFNWQTSAGGTATNNVDFTQSSGTGTISKGSLTTNVSVASIQDVLTESTETFNVVLMSATNATVLVAIGIGSIQDDDFGSFNISGVSAATDLAIDAYLSNSANPTVNWSSSTGASSYDVTIYEDDGTTIKCPLTNTAATSLSFSSCNLTAGLYYKTLVNAKSATGSKPADNSLYRFYVNQSPTLHSSGSGPYYVLAGNSITISAQGGPSPTVGIANDPESETVSFRTINTPSKGTLGANDATSFTLNTSAADFGKSIINVDISDPRGGILTTDVSVFIVQPYTWTGMTSTNWNTPSNWCGSVAANKRSCIGAAALPSSPSVIYFDNTCTSIYTCSPTTPGNIDVTGIRISANGFTQGASNTITVGSSGWTQTGGSFTGSNATIQINASLNLAGTGTFTSTSGSLNIIGGGLSLNSNFSHNNGSVNLNTYSFSISSTSSFYNLTLSVWTAHILTLQNNFTILNDLSLAGAGNTDGFQFDVYGNVSSSRSGSGSTKLRFLGTNNQSMQSGSPGNLPATIVEKTGGILTGGANVAIVGGGLVVASGNVDFTNTSLSMSGGGANQIKLAGNTVKDLTISVWSSGSLYLSDNLIVSNSLNLTGGGSLLPGTPGVKISAGGNVSINFGCGCWAGPINIEMTGNVDSTLSIGSAGGTIAGAAFGGNLIINKPMDTVVMLQSHLSMTQTGQTLVVTSGGMNMMGYNLTTLGLSLSSTTLTKSSGVLTVNGSTIGTGSLYGGTIDP